jgi:hypothetical protein
VFVAGKADGEAEAQPVTTKIQKRRPAQRAALAINRSCAGQLVIFVFIPDDFGHVQLFAAPITGVSAGE